MTRQAQAEREQAIERLRELLQPGDKVYTTVKHVARSGMSRTIDLYVIKDNAPRWLSGYVRHLGIGTWDKRYEAIRAGGCGMDMGFHLVYELSYVLFKEGFDCIGEGCPSNDHSNGNRDYSPHRHSDPGYALRQSWL